MLTTIVGWLWIASGVFFLLKPDWLKSSLTKKGVKHVRTLLFAAAFFVGILLIGTAWDAGGILGTVLLVVGVIAIFKAFFFLRSTVTARIIEWIEPWPVLVFRVIAVLYIAFGVVLVLRLGQGEKTVSDLPDPSHSALIIAQRMR